MKKEEVEEEEEEDEEEEKEEEEKGKIKDTTLTNLKFPLLSTSRLDRRNPRGRQYKWARSPSTELRKQGQQHNQAPHP